jgi:hypothetical protein
MLEKITYQKISDLLPIDFANLETARQIINFSPMTKNWTSAQREDLVVYVYTMLSN